MCVPYTTQINETISQHFTVTCKESSTSATPAPPSPLSLTIDDREGEVEGYRRESLSSSSLALRTKSARSIRPVYVHGGKKERVNLFDSWHVNERYNKHRSNTAPTYITRKIHEG